MSRALLAEPKAGPRHSPSPWAPRRTAFRGRALEIGLVNNMPDPALQATERQFAGLVRAAAGGRPVHIHYYSLPSVPRAPETRAVLMAHYRSSADLDFAALDALIVTGTEPRAANLRDEPYWDEFRSLVDWASENTLSTIWSCLAAHGVVLHMDSIERHRLAWKCAGVFSCATTGSDALLSGFNKPLHVSHSRWNALDPHELARRDYRLLSQSDIAGVDSFVKDTGSKFVFFQGHPEYDETSLLREYRRDVTRFLTGERDLYPNLPSGYFAPQLEAMLLNFQSEAESHKHAPTTPDLPELGPRAGLAANVASTAKRLYRNWFDTLWAEVNGATAIDALAERQF
jgi:homoserine O-succinyltransferase/O-acetyltransferase